MLFKALAKEENTDRNLSCLLQAVKRQVSTKDDAVDEKGVRRIQYKIRGVRYVHNRG